MIRRHITALRASLMAADGAFAIGLFVIVSWLRFGPDWAPTWQSAGIDPAILATAYGSGWVLILWITGLYRLRARWTWRIEAIDLSRATLLVAVSTFCALFVFKLPNVSRLFLVELFVLQGVVAVTSRSALRWAFRVARARGLNVRYMLVVGDGPEARAFATRVERHPELGLQVIGFLASSSKAVTRTGRSHQERQVRTDVLGSIDEIEEILHARIVDEVAICLPRAAWAYAEPITSLCAEEGRIVRIPITGGSPVVNAGRVEDFDGITVLSLVYGPDRAVALASKRLIDLALGFVALVVVSPILIVVALAMLATDGGPVIFRQVRVGLHGRPFTIYKFRTMVRDAEERYEELAELSEIRGAAFKMTNDPRITRVGSFLRKTSIDELPQLINVVRGEMSLVGPRPAPPREVADYSIWHRRRLSMKPGITGLWQVTARSDPDFDRRASLDLDYIDRWSLLLDLRIIARTPFALSAGR